LNRICGIRKVRARFGQNLISAKRTQSSTWKKA
jgi:hypothetical protein